MNLMVWCLKKNKQVVQELFSAQTGFQSFINDSMYFFSMSPIIESYNLSLSFKNLSHIPNFNKHMKL